jgi:threonine/homoserine/homoserine lactone efflux protein
VNFNIDSTLLLSFIWFALVMSVTPGPNCTIAMIAGTRFGVRGVLAHLFGVNVGFSLLLIATSLGAYGLINANPLFAQILKIGGIGYLVWMGWNLGFRRQEETKNADGSIDSNANSNFVKPTLLGSAFFQFANPKAWLFATGSIAAYQQMAQPFWLNIALMAAICASSCAVGILAWASLGTALQGWLKIGRRQHYFNTLAGASLILTALFLI